MTRDSGRIWIGLWVVVLVLLAPLWLWAQAPTPGGTLRVAWEADITGLDPHVSSGLQARRESCSANMS